jgi:hypothetical protein
VVVAQVDRATADEALAGDAQVRRHRHLAAAEPAQAAFGRRDQLAGVEVGVGEQPAQVGDDLRPPGPDGAEGATMSALLGGFSKRDAATARMEESSKLPGLEAMPPEDQNAIGPELSFQGELGGRALSRARSHVRAGAGVVGHRPA